MKKKCIQINKFIISFFSLLFIFSFVAFPTISYASETGVTITVEKSDNIKNDDKVKKSNLYYEIIKNGKRIDYNIKLKIIDENGNIIYNDNVQNGIFKLTDFTFGKYELIVSEVTNDETHIAIKINEEYLKNQDTLKQIIINQNSNTSNSNSPKTGDDNSLI